MDIKPPFPGASFVSSHYFFQIYKDSKAGKPKLICRLVLHESRDREKDGICSDSLTAQFLVNLLGFSVASIFQFQAAFFDTKSVYLNTGSFTLNMYVRLPYSWASWQTVWKLFKPAHSITEGEPLRQHVIQDWHRKNQTEKVPSLPQLLVRQDCTNLRLLLFAKVADDFLLERPISELSRVYALISNRFSVGCFTLKDDFNFYRLHIQRFDESSNCVDVNGYMTQTPLIPTSFRKKRSSAPCNHGGARSFQKLTRAINDFHNETLRTACSKQLLTKSWPFKFENLLEANRLLSILKRLIPIAVYSDFLDASKRHSSHR